MGTYGFLRFCLPLFPRASVEFAPLFAGLAIAGIIYGALMALAQSDLKKLVAYSSVSHLGFVVLGLFAMNPEGIVGGLLQMVNHGINTGALFLLVGMIYDRAHTRMIADFGGVGRAMPVFAAITMVFVLASIGLPSTNGFAGEFLILFGAFRDRPLYGILGATGVVLGAVYMLVMVRQVLWGEVAGAARGLADLSKREIGLPGAAPPPRFRHRIQAARVHQAGGGGGRAAPPRDERPPGRARRARRRAGAVAAAGRAALPAPGAAGGDR